MRILIIHLLLTTMILAGEPLLESRKERTYSPATGQAWGDIHEVVFQWVFPADLAHKDKRRYHIRAYRRPDSKGESLRDWSASVYHESSGSKEGDWYEQPELSRDEFVSILSKSQSDLLTKNTDFHLEQVYVSYHLIQEHEKELSAKIRRIFEEEKGEVKFKHRGIIRRLHNEFSQSKAIALTAKSLASSNLTLNHGAMVGDYYTPVDIHLAKTWLEAANLKGFGLRFPPSIAFQQVAASDR